ncbi:Thiopurine S-methyltransferase (TPMT) [Arenibacter nanhaiticus]|uniref:Thiopurine S-methyltransferase (TPMT) n=1 Tax=Arenibacter nanhaiticus TaxID=558155 RepID=A0A1M6IDY1_9FLAO|nr:methyltransferase domain-containing protein [Arenibacter nanhaiticus]SHJ32657.1 Thiopurine S-methyltransferase (TPMT) [Arenibacter nanhaiticus]
MKNLNKEFWEDRYINQDTGWDIGHISTPLKSYIDQLRDKTIKILIPGAGNGYEAVYLAEQGFCNITVIDIAKPPLEQLRGRLTKTDRATLIEGDFFDLELSDFDLILEQTFFCALDPSLRPAYARKMKQLLKPKGKLAGLLFNFPLTESGPPFGGDQKEYKMLFSKDFTIKILENAYNSIKPRAGKELFFIFESK